MRDQLSVHVTGSSRNAETRTRTEPVAVRHGILTRGAGSAAPPLQE